jgi:hypothetical protein
MKQQPVAVGYENNSQLPAYDNNGFEKMEL